MLQPIATPLWSSLRIGTEYATEQQPDADDRNPWFFADCARFKAYCDLRAREDDGWKLRSDVPNYGIHLLVGGVHLARVLRSLDGSAPPPGGNPRRRRHYQQQGVQGQLALSTTDGLPPLNLIIDWHVGDGEPIVNVSLPYRPWDYQSNPEVHWRVPFPDEAEFENLAFQGETDGDVDARLKIHETELGSA